MTSFRILNVLLGAALLASCGPESAPKQSAERPPQEVGVVTIQPERTEIVTELPGRTAAYRIAEVRPQVGGIILKRLFTEGGDVKAGEQLYQIDPAPYQAAFDSAKAAVARAEAAVEVGRLNTERVERLIKNDVVSQQEYDEAAAALKQVHADLAAARAAEDKARIDLEYTKVLSPIAGTIGRSSVTEGALVTAQQAEALAVVQQLDPIYVDVTQSSAQLLRLQRELASGELKDAGDQEAGARLVLEDGTMYSEPGKLQFSEVSVDPSTGSVTLRAVFPNPRHELLPGMFVRTLVTEGVKEEAILVPQRGVTRNQRGEPVALVVGADDRVESRVLETSRAIGDRWLVTKGLAPGDRVIVEGLQKTGPGAKVKPVEVQPEPAE
jgi:RND family efflux transporter, MFP subunit